MKRVVFFSVVVALFAPLLGAAPSFAADQPLWTAPRGAKVIGFIPESLAQVEGLLEGDIILACNAQDVPDAARFLPLIGRTVAGATIAVKVLLITSPSSP